MPPASTESLGRVAEEADDGAAFAGVGGEPVQVPGAGHAGLVDEDQVAWLEREPRVSAAQPEPASWCAWSVVELVQVLRSAAELVAEDLGGGR